MEMIKNFKKIFFTFLTGAFYLGVFSGCGLIDPPAIIPPTTTAPASPTVIEGSSASSSGTTGVFTADGASYALTPASASGISTGSVKLLTLPNVGNAVAALTVANVSATSIATSLVSVAGTSVDPAQNLGMAYDYNDSRISIFGLPAHATSPSVEISLYDTQTTNSIIYSGTWTGVNVMGAVMNTTNQTLIIATADGFEVVDYTNPAAPTFVREIPSLQADPLNGVEMMENFAFDRSLPVGGTNYSMIITGGRYSVLSTNPVMTLVDANSGTVYRPDAATDALFTTNLYIDAAAVDTTYHVAVLADEGAGTTFVDLTKLTLDSATGTYSLPSTAVAKISTYYKYDNLAIESSTHLVMMGGGCGGYNLVAGLLENPATALGFNKAAIVDMPMDYDDQGSLVYWYGYCDPHGAGAYLTDPTHPTYNTQTALGLWAHGLGSHIAIIDLLGVLDGTLAGGTYDPTTASPKDIAYFAIP